MEKMIKTAVIVSEDSPEDEVGMNNTVSGKLVIARTLAEIAAVAETFIAIGQK